MAKYIDADCLKAEIERLTKTYQDSIWRTVKGETAKDFRDKLLSVIASLQQEHPEIPKIERAEYYYHKGVCEGFSQGSADSLKILEEFMKRKADPVIVIKQQEQPEMDLEKASRNVYESWMGGTMDDVRRDMVELGKVLYAGKDESI